MSKGEIKISIDEMQNAGVNFGHKVSKLHPKMKQYVSGIKNNVHTFDLDKTALELQKTLNYISKLVADGKQIIFVGTKIQLKEIVKSAAEECGVPYVTERWLGGTFTNFETISKRVAYYKELEKKRLTGELEKYTKKERLDFDRELEKLKTKFEGIKNMTKLPDAVFIADLSKDEIVAKEAIIKKIKIIGIADTNVNPEIADYIIPANDDSISSVKYIFEKITEAVLTAKQTTKK
jgi:small subunit ribosomal protein S2